MKRLLLVSTVIVLYLLHQDFWNWRTPNPLILGFLPIGVFYHACYTIAASLLMWLLVARAWPSHLEEEAEELEDRSTLKGKGTSKDASFSPASARPLARSRDKEARHQ